MTTARNRIKAGLCAALAALLAVLAACAPGGAQSRPADTGAPPASAAASSRPAAGEQAGGQAAGQDGERAEAPAYQPVTAFLPADRQDLAALLANVGRAEGLSLTAQTPQSSAQYQLALDEALAGDNPPDLFYVEDLNGIENLPEGLCLDLLGPEVSQLLRALAGLSPLDSAALQGEALAGLPVGYYIEGYLCDIRLLAQLLGTKDTAALQRNIVACSWEEWKQLIVSIEAYLNKPGGIYVTLNGTRYVTPGFRPAGAQQLRGAFALADGEPEALMQNTLGAVVGTAYGSLNEMNEDDQADKTLVMQPAFRTLFGLLDLETMYMSRTLGAPYRGEDYDPQAALDAGQALAQFTAGAALFYRADSRLGASLCAEDPTLEDRLFIVPLKLPPPAAQDEEKAAAGTGEDMAQSSVMRQLNLSVADIVAKNNRRPWYASDGYWCIRAGTQRLAELEALLLRLYTNETDRQALWQALALQPYTELYPEGRLRAQVQAVAATGEGNLLPGSEKATQLAASLLGAAVQQDLLAHGEWNARQGDVFVNQGLGAFGLPQAVAVEEEE